MEVIVQDAEAWIGVTLACFAGVAWCRKKYPATPRFQTLTVELEKADKLYVELCKRTQEVPLTANERVEVKKQSQTLKYLRMKIRDIEDDIHSLRGVTGIVQEYWHFGELITELRAFDTELKTVYKDLLATTKTMNARNDVFLPPGPPLNSGPFPSRAGPFIQENQTSGALYIELPVISPAPPLDISGITRPAAIHMC